MPYELSETRKNELRKMAFIYVEAMKSIGADYYGDSLRELESMTEGQYEFDEYFAKLRNSRYPNWTADEFKFYLDAIIETEPDKEKLGEYNPEYE